MRRKHTYLLVVLVLLLWFTNLAVAQVRSGSIVGLVVDPSGARVPEAAVTVLAVETNVKSETRTNVSGEYTVPYLAPGGYTVTVVREGFVTVKVGEIHVGTEEIVRADVRLQVGSVSSTVEVTDLAKDLQTESATVEHTVDQTLIQELPNPTNNAFYYATLQPGVEFRAAANDTQTERAFGVGLDARRQFSAIAINGGLSFTNEVLLDGTSVIGATFNEASVLPNPDGVQEVHTSINNYSAEYGKGQGVISVTTKGGTNRFHGSASDQLRNEAMNANSFGNNQLSVARPAFKANTYGGTVGGPIVKNRMFFFVSYEGLQHSQSLENFATVPTALERVGNFSQTLVNVSGTPMPQVLFDPFSVTELAPNQYQRAPVPNAIIPNPDPYIEKMMSYYPLPNRTPLDVYNTDNYYLGGTQDFSRNSVNSRLDYQVGKHSLYWTGGLSQGSVNATNPWGAGDLFQGNLPATTAGSGIGMTVSDMNPYASIGDVVILSPTLVLDVRYGITRTKTLNEYPVSSNLDYSQFGISPQIAAITPIPGRPPVGDWGGVWTALETNASQQALETTNHNLVGSITKTVNRWTFKFGGEYRVDLSNIYSGKIGIDVGSGVSVVQAIASYSLQNINSGGSPIGTVLPNQAGNGPASMLLGAGQVGIWSSNGAVPLTLAQKYGAVYTQADWRATPRLTINLGLRWDVQPGATDRYNNICGFDAAGHNPYGGAGGIACAGADGYSRNIYNTAWHNFGPRSGIAYHLTNSLVIRGGYGMTYLPSNTGFRNSPFDWGQDSFSGFTNNNPYGSNPSGTLIGRWNSPAVNPIIEPFGTNLHAPNFYGALRLQKFDRDFPTQNMQQYNLMIEKRFGSDWLISAGYNGTKGEHLLYSRIPVTGTQMIPQSLLSSWRQGYIQANGLTNPGTTQVPNPFQPAGGPLIPFNGVYGGSTITAEQANVPYPMFYADDLQKDIGFSNYNALVVTVEHHFAKGLLVSGHYTWSKSDDFSESEANADTFEDTGELFQDAGSGLDLHNLRNNYAPSFYDVPNRAVISYLYELPFGSGKPLLNGTNPVVRAIVSGWRQSGVATFQSGTPLLITGDSTGSLNGRPNTVPGEPLQVPKALQRWYNGTTTVTLPDGREITPCADCYLQYNPDTFSGNVVTTPNGKVTNDIYWWGDAAQTFGDIRGKGINNWNLSLERSFKVKERFHVDFAARFQNAFNHTQFKPAMTMALGAQSVVVNSPLGIQPGEGQSSNYGTRGNSTYDPRQTELELKVRF